MNLKRILAVSALSFAAIGVAAGTAGAQTLPEPSPYDLVVPVAPGVTYTSYVGGLSTLTSGLGSVFVENGVYRVYDQAGKVIY